MAIKNFVCFDVQETIAATFLNRLTNNFSDPVIHDQCLAVCRLDYLACRANCDSQFCDSACLSKFAGNFSKKFQRRLTSCVSECETLCPCGSDCPSGCRDCTEHPLCQDQVLILINVLMTKFEDNNNDSGNNNFNNDNDAD